MNPLIDDLGPARAQKEPPEKESGGFGLKRLQ
ncbi:MAG: hypothetical protein QOJ16_2833 [Acidobacteriota bacterium]|nr:hypothetical protein [Acidobacteriota bacterium]